MKGPLWAVVACVVGLGLAASPALLSAIRPAASDGEEGEMVRLQAAAVSGSVGGPRADRPTWTIGDAWHVSFDGYDPCWAVVAEVSDEGYHQGWWCEDEGEAEYLATQASAFDLLYVGRLTPELAGRFGESAFPWFDWPLSDGKTWHAEIGNADVDITATWSSAKGRYVMEGKLDDETWATWDYEPDLKWFSALTYESSGWTFEVLDHVKGWDEEIVLADTQMRYQDPGSQIVARYAAPSTFVAEQEDEALYLWIQRPNGFYAEHVEIRAPDGSTMYSGGLLTSNVVGSGRAFEGALIASTPGTWTLARTGTTTGYSWMAIWGAQYTRLIVA